MVSIIKDSIVLVFVAIFGYIAYVLQMVETERRKRNAMVTRNYGILLFGLLMSFAAEYFFGVADITGASFSAGVIIS
ncbi:MAG: hypothetical protein ACLRR3_00410 [Eubacterium sp.]